MIKKHDKEMLQLVINEASKSIDNGGGPFAAAVVSPRGEIVCIKGDTVVRTFDPTARAEVNAIRLACKLHRTYSLEGYTLYTSCEPCPMGFGAIHWAGISRVVYGASLDDAKEYDFRGKEIYSEITSAKKDRKVPMERTLKKEALAPFEKWNNTPKRIGY